MQMASSTILAMENMQDSNYLNEFKSSQDVDGGELLEGLTDYFIQYEVPGQLFCHSPHLHSHSFNHFLSISLTLPLTYPLTLSLIGPINHSSFLSFLFSVFLFFVVGLLNKLFALKEYRLNFIVDDSGEL